MSAPFASSCSDMCSMILTLEVVDKIRIYSKQYFVV